MSRWHYGYDSYRGRSGTRKILIAIIIVLIFVLAVVVAALFVARNYIVYSEDGQARLELPFFQKSSAPPLVSGPVGSGQPGQASPEAEPTPSPTPTPTPTPEPTDPPLTIVSLPREALADGTAAAKVTVAGANAALFDMKADDGTLGYVSSLPEAIGMGTSAAGAGLNEAIQALTSSDLYTIARVSCFRDNRAPRQRNALALRSNAGNWRDNHDCRWLNPNIEDACNYLVGVCQELAGLGFDEILLENAAFPVDGRLGSIKKGTNYDPENLIQPIDHFYTQVKEALAAYPEVKLSIATTEAVLTEAEGDASGQTIAQLAQYADRVYAPASESGLVYDWTSMGWDRSNVILTTGETLKDGYGGWIMPTE